jgi:hypothetical protein
MRLRKLLKNSWRRKTKRKPSLRMERPWCQHLQHRHHLPRHRPLTIRRPHRRAGWTLFPLLGSILAIVFGYAARREIRQRPDELTGEGLAVAGLVLGWLMVGLSVVGLCLAALALCFFTGLSGAAGGY